MAPKKSVYAEDLRAMQANAAKAMEGYTPGGVRVPDGNYVAKEACELRRTDAGKLRIARTFVPVDGEFAGLQIWDGLTLGTPTEVNEIGVQIARRWCEQHGFEWPEDDLAKLEEIINAINDANATCRIRVKTKNDFQNVNVLEVLESGETEPEPEAASEPEPEADPEPEPEAEAEDDGLDAMDRTALKKLINGDPALSPPVIVVTKAMSDDAIRAKIREVRAAAGDDESEGDGDAGEDNSDLLNLCAAQGVDGVSDGQTRAQIIKAMGEYDYEAEKLEPADIALLESVGLGDCVKRPAPKAKLKAATAKPAPKGKR